MNVGQDQEGQGRACRCGGLGTDFGVITEADYKTPRQLYKPEADTDWSGDTGQSGQPTDRPTYGHSSDWLLSSRTSYIRGRLLN